jgi:hypothetical protein
MYFVNIGQELRGTRQRNNFYQLVFFLRTGLVLKSNTSLKNITALHHTITNTQSRENDRAKTISNCFEASYTVRLCVH